MSGPAVPPNEAVPSINSKRLLRFSRPFNPSAKKGATPAVAPRKWREEEEEQQQETGAAAATASSSSSSNNNKQGNTRSYANSVIVTKTLVDEFASKLNTIEKDRALKGLEPIPVNSAAAAQARLERFMPASEKQEFDRSRRFGGNIDVAGADLVGSAPKQANNQQRSRSGGKNNNNNGNKPQQQKQQQQQQPKKDAAPAPPLDEAAQKRLSRFNK